MNLRTMGWFGLGLFVSACWVADASAQGYGFGKPQSNGFYGGLSNLQLAPNHPTRSPSSPPATTNRRPGTVNNYYYGQPAIIYPPVYGGTFYGNRYGVGRPNYGYGGYPYGGCPYYHVPNYGTQLNVYPNGIIQTYRGPIVPRF